MDRLIAKRLMDPHAKVHHLAMLTYRRYLTEYSRIKTESDAAIFVDKYGSERVNTPLYDPDDLVSKAQSFRVGQPLVALDHYHLEFINADSIPELYKFISAYQSSPVGTDPKIKNLIELSDDARNLALVIQMEQRQDADEHVHATAGAHKSATGKQMLAPSSKSVAAGGKPVQWFYVDFQAGPQRPLTYC